MWPKLFTFFFFCWCLRSSGTLFGMYYLDKKNGNTGLLGRYFWRIESNIGEGALEECFAWEKLQKKTNFLAFYNLFIRNTNEMACPCSLQQAGNDRRFILSRLGLEVCYISRFSRSLSNFLVFQQCCYSLRSEDFGSLQVGHPNGGSVQLYSSSEQVYTDTQAYKFCCVDANECGRFYFHRPSDNCFRYRPLRTRKFFAIKFYSLVLAWRIACLRYSILIWADYSRDPVKGSLTLRLKVNEIKLKMK